MAKDFTLEIRKFLGYHASQDSTQEIADGESPDMVNFKVVDGLMLKKREGYFSVFSSGTEPIRGIWSGRFDGKWLYLAVVGNTLYRSLTGFSEMEALTGEIAGEEKVFFFPFHGAVHLLTGEGIFTYEGKETVAPLEPYVPLIMIATPPAGNGVVYEEVNLLTREVRQSFSPDGVECRFYPVISTVSEIVWVKMNGVVQKDDQYYFDEAYSCITFLRIPPEGVDTIEVQYRISGESAADRILNCRFAVTFGGANDTRAFLYGNDDSQAVRYHSGIIEGKPCFSYFPETAYTFIGSGEAITSILRHYDRLLIFTETSAYYSYLEYITGVDGNLIAAFPVLPLSDENGCSLRGQALLLENTPCTFTEKGLFRWVSTNIRDERNAVLFSDPIAYALEKEQKEHALLFHRKATSELYLCIDGHLYVYNYRLKLFYYYEVPCLKGFAQGEKGLYFYTENGIYQVGGETDDGAPIQACWRSRLLDFGKRKQIKKLFGIVVYTKTKGKALVKVHCRKENRGEVTDFEFHTEEEQEQGVRNLSCSQGNFRLFEVCLETEGTEPLCVLGLSLRGRITDRSEKR